MPHVLTVLHNLNVSFSTSRWSVRLPSAWQSLERVEFVRFPPASLREVEVGHTMGDFKISGRSSNLTVVICPRTRVAWRFRWDVFLNVFRGIIFG